MDSFKIRRELQQFIGTDDYHAMPLARNVKFSDGVAFLASRCNAFWFVTDALIQLDSLIRLHKFITIELHKDESRGNTIVIFTDGNGHIIKQQDYDFTTFPLSNYMEGDKICPAITLFCQHSVLYLPSEH